MQSRVSFNSGEVTPELDARVDVEPLSRACEKLENWEVSQLGGIKRRRGMRSFALPNSDDVHLVPYVYSYSDVSSDEVRFLVEVGRSSVRVFSLARVDEYGHAICLASFESGSATVSGRHILDFSFTPLEVRYFQINNLLFLTSLDNAPLVLKFDGAAFSLEPWQFKHRVWRYNHEQRDEAIKVVLGGDSATVDFSGVTDARDLPASDHVDYLRASFYLEQQECSASSVSMRQDVSIVSGVPAFAAVGAKFAVRQDDVTVKYFVCTQDWAVDSYVSGLELPTNYTGYFTAVEDANDSFHALTPVYSIKNVQSVGIISKGTKIAIKSAYWDYWYCFKAFSKPAGGSSDFAAYPDYFFHGLPYGPAATCRSGWSFYVSGLWFGKYAVYRHDTTSDVNADWEAVGSTFSRVFAASNIMPSGSEPEECYLRAFLEKSRCLDNSSITPGFPTDDCSNRLIVNSYKHDAILRCEALVPGGTEIRWTPVTPVRLLTAVSKLVHDWSWQGFSKRYGYPLHASFYLSRLVFAATREQPQTLWLSRPDDLDNFLPGTSDDSSLWLTINSVSQNPICWVHEQHGELLVGTSYAEYAVAPSVTTGVLTPSTASAKRRSNVGSSSVPALLADNNILFVSRGGGKVYEMAYSLERDGLVSADISLFAPHIFREHGGVRCASFADKPDTVAYFVLGDGTLALCTYNSLQQVKAWHRWHTDGRVLDVCALPDGSRPDRVFFLVQRDGRTAIEVIDDESDFVDNGGRDYESLVVTTPLVDVRNGMVDKVPSTPISLFFGADVALYVGEVAFAVDGGENERSWFTPQTSSPVLSRGWYKTAIAPSGWTLNRRAAVRVRGLRGFELLCIQG